MAFATKSSVSPSHIAAFVGKAVTQAPEVAGNLHQMDGQPVDYVAYTKELHNHFFNETPTATLQEDIQKTTFSQALESIQSGQRFAVAEAGVGIFTGSAPATPAVDRQSSHDGPARPSGRGSGWEV